MFVDFYKFADIDYILEHLCNNAIQELKIKFGEDYLFDTIAYLYNIPVDNIKIIRLKENNEPVALFGIKKLSDLDMGIFFLSTDNIYKGNMITFLKGTKEYILKWNEKYNLFDDCYKKNDSVIKWLKFLGFEPTEEEDKDFQIYKRVMK